MSATEAVLEAEEESTVNSLPDHPLFEGLSNRHRQTLAECAMRARFRAGEKVVETGETADCFYLLLSGTVSLETPGGRNPLRIKTLGGGDILGWSWLFPPDFWHFDAVVSAPTEVVYFYGSRLRQQCDIDQGLGYELFKRLANRRKAGKSILMTPDPANAAADSSGTETEPEIDPSPGLLRPKLNVFALTVETADEEGRDGISTSTWWPKILFDNAKAAIRSVAGASGEKQVPALPRV